MYWIRSFRFDIVASYGICLFWLNLLKLDDEMMLSVFGIHFDKTKGFTQNIYSSLWVFKSYTDVWESSTGILT